MPSLMGVAPGLYVDNKWMDGNIREGATIDTNIMICLILSLALEVGGRESDKWKAHQMKSNASPGRCIIISTSGWKKRRWCSRAFIHRWLHLGNTTQWVLLPKLQNFFRNCFNTCQRAKGILPWHANARDTTDYQHDIGHQLNIMQTQKKVEGISPIECGNIQTSFHHLSLPLFHRCFHSCFKQIMKYDNFM